MKKILFILGALSVVLSSCTTKPEYPWGRPDAPITKPSLVVENSKIQAESEVKAKFSVYSAGENVTAESNIFIINGTDAPIAYEELTFSSNQKGEYTFYAEYNNEVSEKQVVYVVDDVNALPEDSNPSSISFHNRVLLTDFTGTLCANCPLIVAALQELEKTENHEKVEIVACHSYASDPMGSDYVTALASQMGIVSYPQVIYNMKSDVYSSTSSTPLATLGVINGIINQEWVENAAVGIAASTHIEEGTIAVNIAVKAAVADTYHVNAFLVEDSIKAAQLSDNPELVEQYNLNIHSHVIRTGIVESVATSDFKGKELGTIAVGATKEVSAKIAYKSEWNLNNCHVVIYVSNPSGVVNTIKCSLTDSVPYDYNE